MFLEFLFSLRRQGLAVGLGEWLAFHEGLHKGLIHDLHDLYGIGRAILVHREGHYDAYDIAFAETFEGVSPPDLHDALEQWLKNPIPMDEISVEAFERLTGLSLEELQRRFEEMLKEQQERHDGGNRYIGTGGTSPFGSGGRHPTGIRLGPGGGRSAIQVAQDRRFRNYRSDRTLDIRQFKVAFRALRNLAREGEEILDIDGTIDQTCQQGGEIELVFGKDRRNSVRLLLLMDTGGSMDPYAHLVERLFTASNDASHWREYRHYFFHNIVYGNLYTDMEQRTSVTTADVLRQHDRRTRVVWVGDACMAPWELTMAGGAISWRSQNRTTGLQWLQRFRKQFPSMVWLNPEPARYWGHPTIEAIGSLVPMFPLSLDGLRQAIAHLQRTPA